ncbi:hypothetical protein [Hyalangium versicolor]|uniref:hypothetical protein n=1 Tax=Hyalangium versicolor TaxID=2861190 RepID=UPI00359F58EC
MPGAEPVILQEPAREAERSIPVSGLSGLAAVESWEHSVPVRQDGTVWAWGYNGFGELVGETVAPSLAPVSMSELMGTSALDTAPTRLTRKDNQTGEQGNLGVIPHWVSIVPRRLSLSRDSRPLNTSVTRSASRPLARRLELTVGQWLPKSDLGPDEGMNAGRVSLSMHHFSARCLNPLGISGRPS